MVQHRARLLPSFPLRRVSVLDDCSGGDDCSSNSLVFLWIRQQHSPGAIVTLWTEFKAGLKLFFLTVSNILCVNNWNDSLGKWGFFFLQKGTHTTHAHLLPGVELCSLRSIPDSRLSRHRNDAPLHRATPPTPTIYYPHHLFFFFFSLKLNYSPERHGTFSRLLASIKAVVNVLQAGASDSLTSTEERGKKCVDESCNMN